MFDETVDLLDALRLLVAEKGKPGENQRRKASGLRVLKDSYLRQQGCLKQQMELFGGSPVTGK